MIKTMKMNTYVIIISNRRYITYATEVIYGKCFYFEDTNFTALGYMYGFNMASVPLRHFSILLTVHLLAGIDVTEQDVTTSHS